MNMEPVNPELELAKAAAEGMGKESINKLSEVIGNIFPFWDTKRIAVETYIAEVQKSNLSPVHKMLAIADAKKTLKHLKNQSEIASIAMSAAKEGTDFSPESKVDDEWLERFMDSAKFVSDKEVQAMWGKILAGEFEKPGSTPPSVTRILTEITPKYAKIFQALCSLSIYIYTVSVDKNPIRYTVVFLPKDYSYLSSFDISFNNLNELQTLGLIQFDYISPFIHKFNNTQIPKIHISYGKQAATISQYKNEAFPAGCVLLTASGRSIARSVTHSIIPNHFEAVCDYMVQNDVVFSETPEILIE